MAGDKAKEYPSFWIPQLNPTVEVKIEKPASFILQFQFHLLRIKMKKKIVLRDDEIALLTVEKKYKNSCVES